MKRQPAEWELSHIHEKTQKLNTKRRNNPINECTNELNRQFSKEVQMANKYMKKRSTSIAIMEIQINITLRFRCIPLRMGLVKETSRNKCR
jgi:hypothetical protein